MPSLRAPRLVAPVAGAAALAVAYSRFSTDEQDSTKDQVNINEETALEERVQIVAHFNDRGVSRSIGSRPELQAMIAYLEDHPEIRFLVVNELERLTAGVEQRHEIARLCKRLRITIITSDMGRIDPHDEEKMHEADQRAVMSEGEVIKVRKRTRRNLRAKVRAGDTVAMRPAYGVRMRPLVGPDGTPLPSGVPLIGPKGKKIRSGELELHPDEHPWLVKIFEWAHEGKSSDWIAKRLTAEGVPTKRGNAAWRGNTINGILDNPFYKGELTWGAQQVRRGEGGRKYLEVREEGDPGRITRPSPLGAIVPVTTWDAIHEARQGRERTRKMTRRSYDPQVFDDIAYCGRCGHRMYGRNDNPGLKTLHWRYYCYSARTGYQPLPEFGHTCAMAHSMSLKDVLNALAGLGGEGATVTVTTGAVRDDRGARRRRVEARMATAREEYDRAVRLTKKGLQSEDALEADKAELDRLLDAAEAELAALDSEPEGSRIVPFVGEVADTFATLAELLRDESLPIRDRVDALRAAGVERVYLDKPGLRLHLRG